MFSRRVLLSVLVAIGLIGGGGIAAAKNHKHHDAHALLGAKLHQNGKHEVGKLGNNTVTAEVNNNKVTNMSAGGLPVHKVRSKKKMASLSPSIVQVMQYREALDKAGFILAETLEVLNRGWHLDGAAVRPDHRMVAHTGFLTTARRGGE